MQRTYAGLQRPDCEREPPDCEDCLSRDAMLDELQRDRDQYMAWYALADAERRQAQAEVERLEKDNAEWQDGYSALTAEVERLRVIVERCAEKCVCGAIGESE
jgi:molecular chaperone GrpE (heat shock protein)